jgi:hypothetical protein
MNLNAFLDPGHLALWLLVAGLFFPRLSLLAAWLIVGDYPPNVLSNLVNCISWLFFPRFLMAYYIYTDQGPNNLWFWAYLLAGIFGFFGETGYMRHRIIRRTTVSPDGTTTTVEEEAN